MVSSSSSSTPGEQSISSTTNDGSGISNPKFKRNYRACLNCRVRKVKCDLGSVDQPRDGKCARCLRERKDCVFVDSKRGGSVNIKTRKKRKFADEEISHLKNASDSMFGSDLDNGRSTRLRTSGSSSESSIMGLGHRGGPFEGVVDRGKIAKESDERSELRKTQSAANDDDNNFTTVEGALVFLANAAGSIARADERDNIDARKKHQQLEESIRGMSSRDVSILEAKRVDQYDDIRSQTASSSHSPGGEFTAERRDRNKLDEDRRSNTYVNSRRIMPAAENGDVTRPRASNSLSSMDYIGGENGILNEHEAEHLINLFFTTMHPFFPYLPKWMHSSSVLPRYPILLCAILTIAARYHPLENKEGNNGMARSTEIHDKLWLYGQRLISQTVWAEASTRSIGTVFAFLLFTEWNPRAIHWRWSDYANKADDGNEGDQANALGAKSSDESHLAGLGAMRRSYRMAWMLIGSSIRLAQDMGFIDVSPDTFLAIHVSEINSAMNISGRSMLAHSLSEVELDESEEIDFMDEESNKEYDFINMSEEEMKRIGRERPLRFSFTQRAQLELLQIISLGHESLYSVKVKPDTLPQRQVLSLLGILSPLIANWGRKYKALLIPTKTKVIRNLKNMHMHSINSHSKSAKDLADSIQRESFIFEYNYVKVYLYSLALSPPRQTGENENRKQKPKFSLKLDDISKSAKYIEQAFNAANEMLAVTSRVHRLKRLKFMPVRWLTRTVRAIAFIVKCYLTITAHNNSRNDSSPFVSVLDNFDSTVLSLSLISIDEIMQSVQKAAITLRDSAPDELHLCTRYSNVLMYLYSEMKTKAKNGNNREENVDKVNSDRSFGEGVHASGHEDEYSDDLSRMYDANESPLYEREGVEYANNREGLHTQEASDKDSSKTPQVYNLIEDSEVMEWFGKNNDIGLDFVGPWTEMIEQQLASSDQYNPNDPFF